MPDEHETPTSATEPPAASNEETDSGVVSHDQLFKLLLTRFLYEFLQLFFPKFYQELDTTIPPTFLEQEAFVDIAGGQKHIADILAQVKYKQQDTILVLTEHQSTPQTDFGKRLFFYFADFRKKHDYPVYPIVVFSYTEPRRPEPSVWIEQFPDGEVLRFSYRVVQLNQNDWRNFVGNPNPVAAALMARMRFAPSERPLVKLACLRMLVGLPLSEAEQELIGVFVDSYLPLNSAEMSVFLSAAQGVLQSEEEPVMKLMTSWHRAGREEGLQEGREEGLQEGREEGLQEGRQEGLQEGVAIGIEQAAVRILTRRLGTLPKEVMTRISSLSLSRREALLEALLDFVTLEDLIQWLDANATR